MTRLKTAFAILGATALTVSLSACGGGGDYCDLLADAQENVDLENADPTDPEALGQMTDAMKEIADAAPSEVSEDWTTMTDAFQAMVDADGDLTAIDPEALGDVETASTNIEEHAKSECDIEL